MSSVSGSGIAPPPVTNLFTNSGMDIEGIISKLIAADSQPITQMQQQESTIKTQQSAYNAIQTKIQALLTSIEKLTDRDIVSGQSIFDNKATTSTNSSIVTATATGAAPTQTLNVEVQAMPTATKATSANPIGAMMDANTTLSQLGVTDGNFTVFVNGQAKTISISSTGSPPDTKVSDVLGKIQTAIGGTASASVVNGQIQINTGGATVSLGAASGDTSNFLSKTGLNTAVTDASGNVSASKGISLLALGQPLASANLATPVTDGTFTVNGVSFDTTGKSLSDIITSINSSTANVTANFNATTNKLELTSKSTGSSLISLSNGTGNFLQSMGLLAADGSIAKDSLGNSSQVAGTNAKFVVNGTTMYSSTATVDETVTGLTGVTLNLAQAQVGTSVQIGIQQDTSSIVSAVQDVVSKYNDAISLIDQATDAKNGGVLTGNNQIINLRNQIRSMFTSQVGGLSSTAYDSLQQVGVGTAAVASGGSASPTISVDADKLTAALKADPSTIKKLFIAQDLQGTTSSNDDNMEGTFTQLQHLLSDKTYTTASGTSAYGALYSGGDGNSGIFPQYQTTVTARIKALDDSITAMQDRMSKKEDSLRQQFTSMDQLIGQYQSQGSAITNLISQLNANK